MLRRVFSSPLVRVYPIRGEDSPLGQPSVLDMCYIGSDITPLRTSTVGAVLQNITCPTQCVEGSTKSDPEFHQLD